MKTYKTKHFAKWAKKEEISDNKLVAAINEMNNGLIDATLGQHVYKKRVAATGKGKRGSFRTILAFKADDKAFFIYGYAKNQIENISKLELSKLKALAELLLNYDEQEIKKAQKDKVIIEVKP